MNKKSIAHIRNQFKADNELLKITDIFNVYVKKETNEIYHQESASFDRLDAQQQELFFGNFKKVLTGKLDQKVFELKFEYGAEDSSREILYYSLTDSVEAWKDSMLRIVSKIFTEQYSYAIDTVVTFIRGEYAKPTTKRSEESEEGGNDEVFKSKFILCSINSIEQQQKALVFDYNEKEFRSNNIVDPIINLKAPLVGFMFPAFNDGAADVNHILYSASRANEPDRRFISEVLNCQDIVTAISDKVNFENILRKAIGTKVEPAAISAVYEKINNIVEADQDGTAKLDVSDIQGILDASDVVLTQELEEVFKDVLDNENAELKASSLIPSFNSKSIKINTKIADVSISPKELGNLRQVTHKGKKCLLIEIDENVMIDGLEIAVEKL